MSKFKICPDCGFHNPPSLIECSRCEADLTRVALSDENSHNAAVSAPASMVRICGCGAENPPAARKCLSCGEDISDIIPTEKGEKRTHFMLTSLDGEFAAELISSEETVGREGFMSEYLSDKEFVSRRHARLFTENGRLYAEDLQSTNHTYVNNKMITAAAELFDGDELAFGGCEVNSERQSKAAYFTVRICCT